MMKGFIIAAIIVIIASVVFLFWEPVETQEQAQDRPALLSVGAEKMQPVLTTEKTMISEEVRMLKDGVYHVAAGDELELVFLLDEQEFIVIEEAGFAEYVQAGNIRVSFDHPGTYDLICLSCDDPRLALIIVS